MMKAANGRAAAKPRGKKAAKTFTSIKETLTNPPATSDPPTPTRPATSDPPTPTRPATSDPPEYRPGNCRLPVGRIASNIAPSPLQWFCPDMVVRNELNFVVGPPDSGKSTFGAWLCKQADRPAILPGIEESVESGLIPRLRVGQVALERTLVLDGRPWNFPGDRQALTEALIDHCADFLWIDPIDTYMSSESENDGQAVRAGLEALVRAAHDARVTIVCARHPGKHPSNLLPGSRQWRAVPRAIVKLAVDTGPPLRRFCTRAKPAGGDRYRPREYTLLGEMDEPKRFVLGPEVDPSELDAAGESDLVERRKIDDAAELLKGLLAETEQESSMIFAVADKEKLGDKIMRRAAAKIGVKIRREGVGREHRTIWSLPTLSTPDIVTETPPPAKKRARGGVSVTMSGVDGASGVETMKGRKKREAETP